MITKPSPIIEAIIPAIAIVFLFASPEKAVILEATPDRGPRAKLTDLERSCILFLNFSVSTAAFLRSFFLKVEFKLVSLRLVVLVTLANRS